MSRATYIRKKRNRETCWRQSKALKRVQREAKRKPVAQPAISHEAEETIPRSRAARTDVKFPGIIHVSHQLALLRCHENVFSSGHNAVPSTLGGSVRLLKCLCDGFGRQKATRKLERGLMPNEHVVADAKRAFYLSARSFFLDDAGCSDSMAISLVIKKKRELHTSLSQHRAWSCESRFEVCSTPRCWQAHLRAFHKRVSRTW